MYTFLERKFQENYNGDIHFLPKNKNKKQKQNKTKQKTKQNKNKNKHYI